MAVDRSDRGPDGRAWARLIGDPLPSIADHNPRTTAWRTLLIDPDLAGVPPQRARPERVEICHRDTRSPWTLPIASVLPTRLAWHPDRPLVAGLAVRDNQARPWVADYRARTVRVFDHVTAGVGLTELGAPDRPPLAWRVDGRLILLVPAGIVVADPVWQPIVHEATGPGYVTFDSDPADLARLASTTIGALDIDSGEVDPVSPPLLVRDLWPSPSRSILLVEHVLDCGGERDRHDGLRWTKSRVDLSGRVERVTADARWAVGEQAELLHEHTSAAVSSRVPAAGEAVHSGSSSSRLTVRQENEHAPLLLWIRAFQSGDSFPGPFVDPAPADLPTAILDISLHWSSDVDAKDIDDQLASAVSAALEELADRHNGQIVVGGHSFGATLALRALVTVPRFCAAIVHSGCYNRTLTSTGFQFEKRSLWVAPALYDAFSALRFADRIDRPVLIVHGLADINPATPPDQAVELYRGIVANGGTARLVLIPDEGHNLRHRETRQTLGSEHRNWLERWGGAEVCGAA